MRSSSSIDNASRDVPESRSIGSSPTYGGRIGIRESARKGDKKGLTGAGELGINAGVFGLEYGEDGWGVCLVCLDAGKDEGPSPSGLELLS